MFDSKDLRKQADTSRRLAEQAYSERGREEFTALAQQLQTEAEDQEQAEEQTQETFARRQAND